MNLCPYVPYRRCLGTVRATAHGPQSGHHSTHLFPRPHLVSELPTSLQILHQKKLELMTEKDDLILNVSRKFVCLDTRTFHTYPTTVSTLANCTETYKLVLTVLYSKKTAQDFYDLILLLQNPTW